MCRTRCERRLSTGVRRVGLSAAISFLVALGAATLTPTEALSQQVMAGIFSQNDTTLAVKAKANAAFSNSPFSEVVVTIRWASAYNVSLSNVVSAYGIQKSIDTLILTSRYAVFVATPTVSLSIPSDSEFTLFTVNFSRSSGTGEFALAPKTDTTVANNNWAWDFEANGGDETNLTTEFYQASIEVALPVQLTSLIATANGRKVDLRWMTATELNSSLFAVERKDTGGVWVAVGQVPASGTSTSPKQYGFEDRIKETTSGTLSYRLKNIDRDGRFDYSAPVSVQMVPRVFSLEQNYPNPFNPETKIEYGLPEDSRVSLKIYDLRGREIITLVDEEEKAGYFEKDFAATRLSSGIYFYRLVAEVTGKKAYVAVKKMVLLK